MPPSFSRLTQRWCRRTSLPGDYPLLFLSIGNTSADDLQNRLFNLFRSQPGGVDIDGVGRLRERRLGAMAVTLVAFGNLRGEFPGRHIGLLAGAAADAFHRVGIEEN